MRRASVSLVLSCGVLFSTLVMANTEAHGEAEGIPFSLVYAAINFLILMGLLVFFLRKPAKDFFASRSTLLRTNLEQAKELKENAEKKYTEYEFRLRNVEQEMRDLLNSLKADGQLEKQRLIQSAQEQATNLKLTSERILSQELRKAKEDLRSEAVHLASSLAEDLLRSNLTPQDQGRLVEQYLQQMEKQG